MPLLQANRPSDIQLGVVALERLKAPSLGIGRLTAAGECMPAIYRIPTFSIQLLSSGVTDENRIFIRPGVPAIDSTALP